MGINYKCEPLRERLDIDDDPAYVFSSKVHGDPVTPILEAYPGEEIVIRLIDGAQEEQHGFNINGMKWRREINDENSPLVQAQSLGISEVFNIKIEDNDQAGDYMYYFGGQDDLWLGLWGIIRIYGTRNHCLRPIKNDYKYPNQKNIFDYDTYNFKEFHIAAIQKDLKYNSFDDHDPNGLLFVPYEYRNEIIRGDIEPIPLILRANKVDYIKLTLTNCFDKQIPYFKFPGVPVDKHITPSMRVGISPQFLDFNPITSGGVNIGYNDIEQTVGPGKSMTYMWHADKEYGTCLLTSLTDIRNHRYHGLFGAIIIEPEGASIINSNGYDIYKEQATIKVDSNDQFREFVLFMQNGIRLVDVKGDLIETNKVVEDGEEAEAVDFEDRGEKGFNYKSERFCNRLEEDEDIFKVFSSLVHGYPSTRILEAYAGEKVIIRLLMPADKPRNTCFVLHGHQCKAQNDDSLSNIISVQGAIGVGNIYNIELLDGASLIQGDYLYRSGIIRWYVESGMWGIMRIKDESESKESSK